MSAHAVDPERMFVYWEVTDESRARAAEKLGSDPASARLNVRVYDTTGRLFDGTNAHSAFDYAVDNGARQRFFDVGKPGSDAFVDVGVKSEAGKFVRIARSRKVTFPRRAPALEGPPRWVSVSAPRGESTLAGAPPGARPIEVIPEPRPSGAPRTDEPLAGLFPRFDESRSAAGVGGASESRLSDEWARPLPGARGASGRP